MRPTRLVYLSPQFPKRRHGFELTELLVLADRCDLTIVSLRPPGPADWDWLERSRGRELRSRIRVVTQAACLRGLLRHPAAAVAPRFWWYLALAVARFAPKGILSVLSCRGLACGAREVCRDLDPDLLHADFASLPATVAALWSAAVDRPFSFCGHAFDVFSTVPAGRASAALLASKCRSARAVFAANSLVAQHLRPRLRPGQEVVLKRNGISAESPEALPARATADGPVALYLGELVPKKGVGFLLGALRRAPAWRAIVHGSGPLEAKLRTRAAAEALPVVFRGAYAPDDLPRLLAEATVLIMPSIPLPNGDSDGVPTVVLEAAALGVPTIASDVGAMRDFILDGVTGRLVTPGSATALSAALLEVAAHPERARAWGEAARRRVREQFVADREAPKILASVEAPPAPAWTAVWEGSAS